MKNLSILMVIVLWSTSLLASDVPPHWMYSDNGVDIYKSLSTKDMFSSWGFRKKMNSYLEFNRSSLNDMKVKEKGKWGIAGFNTNLGLTLSGKIGVVGWGGSKNLKLFWKRAAKKETPQMEKINETNSVDLSNYNKWEDAKSNIVKTVGGINELGEANIEKAHQFFDLVKAVEALPQGHRLRVGKIHLQLELGASIPVGSVFTKVGVGTRLWLIWKRRPGKKIAPVSSLTTFQKTAHNFVGKTLTTFSSMKMEEKGRGGFKFNFMRVGFTLGAGGSIGIASANGSAKVMLEFVKTPAAKVTKTVVLDEQAETTPSIALITDSDKKFGKILISSKRLKRGMKKAFKMVDRVMKRVEKDENKNSKGKWFVYEIWSIYAFSASGTLGVVTLKAAPLIHLSFTKKGGK